MPSQLEAFLVDEDPTHPASIGLILRDADVIEDEGQLVPSCTLTRTQALQLAYALGELAQKLPA